MIHNTFLIRISTKEVLAATRYWPVNVSQEVLEEYIKTREDLRSEENEETDLGKLALIIGDHKFHGVDLISDMLLLFVTDKGEDETSIFGKVEVASKALKKEIIKTGLQSIQERYEKLIESSVTTRLKIALVGEGGVGKTTTLHLLLGDTPPLQYVPTIALNLETVENIRFGNYSLVLWDFAGQERFRMLWRFYFHGADVIFLVCDSALRNVIISKDILKLIKRDAPKVPVFALANKQDKPNAMKPEVVQKILGIPTYPMVAIDKAKRDEMLRILMTAAAQYVGVALPDLPASELLRFTDAATEEAIAETDAMAEKHEAAEISESADESEREVIEVVEEVIVDENGNVIENIEDYEIIEEVIEEVEESFPERDIAEEVAKSEEIAASENAVEDLTARLEVSEESVDISISEPEVALERTHLDIEFSDEHIVHNEIDMVETQSLRSENEPLIEAPIESPPQIAAEQSSEDDFQALLREELEALMDPYEKAAIKRPTEEVSSAVVAVEETPPPEEALEIQITSEDNNGDVKLAKEIIFEALEADDFISAEIDLVPHSEIGKALEAFRSDETLPTEGESDVREEIDAESLEELEMILGPLDSAVGGMSVKASNDEKKRERGQPIDDETLNELNRLLDFVDSREDSD